MARIIRSYEILPAIQSGLDYRVTGSTISIGAVLLAVWVAGAVIFVLREAAKIIRFDVLRRNYIVCEDSVISEVASELGIEDAVVISSCVLTPHVAGVFRQKIYVPPLELDKTDWKYILLHEKRHIEARDQLIKLMFHILRAVFWWNPVSHLFVKELDAMPELRCDSAVTSDLDDEVSLEYFTAMLHAIKEMSTDGKALPMKRVTVGIISESKADIRERYEVYLNINKRKSRKVRNAIQVAIFLLFIISYSFIVQPAYMPPEEELVGTDEIADNVSSLIMTDGENYWLIIDDEIIMEIT